MDIKTKLRQALLEQAKPKVAAGVLIRCIRTNRVLLLQRNENGGRYHGVWSLMSGGIEEGESVIDGLKREVTEEMSINPNLIDYVYIGEEWTPQKTMTFHYYEGFTMSEFIPTLDHENMDYGWFSEDDLPTPLYPKLDSKLQKIWQNQT